MKKRSGDQEEDFFLISLSHFHLTIPCGSQKYRFMRSILRIVIVILFAAPFVAGEEAKPDEIDGASLYSKFGCQGCHGTHRGGTARGPSLRSLVSNWDERSLTVYLKNPMAAREKDERLRKISNRYTPVRMAQFDFTDVDLKALVRFLLQNPRAVPKPKEPSSD